MKHYFNNMRAGSKVIKKGRFTITDTKSPTSSENLDQKEIDYNYTATYPYSDIPTNISKSTLTPKHNFEKKGRFTIIDQDKVQYLYMF